MATRNQLDSNSTYWRWVQRWKRGATAAIIVSVTLILPSVLASIALEKIAQALGGSDWWQAVGAFLGLAIAGPLVIGDRKLLVHIGALAKIEDD